MNNIITEWREILENNGFVYHCQIENEDGVIYYFVDKCKNKVELCFGKYTLTTISGSVIRFYPNHYKKSVISYDLCCEKELFVKRISEYLNQSNEDFKACVGCKYFAIEDEKYYCYKGFKNYGIIGHGFRTFEKMEKCIY